MASTPTSKSQVQAYRFVLRRMESALVRKDAVMLHDPMRTHKRATVVGVIVGVVILLGFLIVNILAPSNALPTEQASIVIAQPSGQIYVLDQNPRQLIPVFNLASARLLLLAQSQSQSQGAGSGAGGAAASSSSSSNGPVVPTVVPDSELAGVPMGRLTGIPDGPQALPGAVGAAQNWEVCDQITPNPNAPDRGASNPAISTVLVGASPGGTELTPSQALYVQDDSGAQYLIYHTSPNANDPNDTAFISRIDTTDQYVVSALNVVGQTPRHISGALLNAIPKGPEIQDPFKGIPGAGNTPGAGGATIGQVFKQTLGGTTYYAVLPSGVQKVSETVATILLGKYEQGQGQIPDLPQSLLANLNPVTGAAGLPNVDRYPDARPTILNAAEHSVACLNWNADYTTQNPQVDTQLTVGTQVNLPSGAKALPIGQVGANGLRVDSFAMNPASLSLGLTVRSATGADQFRSGPIMLITPRGVTYSIDSAPTAVALGVANSSPAPPANGAYGLWPGPAEIIGLLPTGSQELNPVNVQRTFDSVQVPPTAGQYTPMATAAGGP